MAYTPYFVNSEIRQIKDKKLPHLSHSLDAVRRYGWEVVFYNLPVDAPAGTEPRPLTLACKNITPIGNVIDEIVADRGNDKFFYPGKSTPTDVTFTFDNLFATKTGAHLYNWIKTIYNQETGEFTAGLSDKGAGGFKIVADIIELNAQGQPFTFTRLYGLWPKSFSEDERSYDANEFHTITLGCRYDFAVKHSDTNT
jgi:hypothetical protein